MKHNKVWYTCDRCGKEFNMTPSDCPFLPFRRKKCYKPKKMMKITTDLKGFIGKTELISTECVSAEIIEFYDRKEEIIELCPDCRKAFERFMKNE